MPEKDRESSVVVDDGTDPQRVVEKPTLSAAKMKRPVGRKAPPSRPSKYAPAPEGAPDDHFLCGDCGKVHPQSERGEIPGKNNRARCKACAVLAASIKDGTFRKNGATFASMKRGQHKATAKNYRKPNAKFPKWMFS